MSITVCESCQMRQQYPHGRFTQSAYGMRGYISNVAFAVSCWHLILALFGLLFSLDMHAFKPYPGHDSAGIAALLRNSLVQLKCIQDLTQNHFVYCDT